MKKRTYIEQLTKNMRENGAFDITSESYIAEDIFKQVASTFMERNLRYGENFELSDRQLEIVIEESENQTIKNTISFLSQKDILQATAINKSTGEFIYTLTDHGKSVYKKIIQNV